MCSVPHWMAVSALFQATSQRISKVWCTLGVCGCLMWIFVCNKVIRAPISSTFWLVMPPIRVYETWHWSTKLSRRGSNNLKRHKAYKKTYLIPNTRIVFLSLLVPQGRQQLVISLSSIWQLTLSIQERYAIVKIFIIKARILPTPSTPFCIFSL